MKTNIIILIFNFLFFVRSTQLFIKLFSFHQTIHSLTDSLKPFYKFFHSHLFDFNLMIYSCNHNIMTLILMTY